jgi:hypothetical protein
MPEPMGASFPATLPVPGTGISRIAIQAFIKLPPWRSAISYDYPAGKRAKEVGDNFPTALERVQITLSGGSVRGWSEARSLRS